MLTVLLSILKFIGIFLLCIIGLVLALVLLLLLSPITYRLEGESRDEQIKGGARGTYLFGLIRFSFIYPEPGKFSLKVLWIDLMNRKEKGTKEISESKPAANPDPTTSEESEERKPDTDEIPLASEKEPALTMSEESTDEAIGETDPKKEEKKKFDPEALWRKIKEKGLRLQSKAKILLQEYHFYQNLLEDEDTQKLLKNGKKHLFKILKVMFPRKAHLEGRFGSGSPDTTGYVFGIYTLFASRFDGGSYLEPDFDEKVMEGELRAKGYFNLWVIGWHVICVLLDKRLRLTKKRLEAHKETMEKRKDREEARIATELES
jgi:hypothetical protein